MVQNIILMNESQEVGGLRNLLAAAVCQTSSKHYWTQWDRLRVVNVFCIGNGMRSTEICLQLVLPVIWRDEIMSMLHEYLFWSLRNKSNHRAR